MQDTNTDTMAGPDSKGASAASVRNTAVVRVTSNNKNVADEQHSSVDADSDDSRDDKDGSDEENETGKEQGAEATDKNDENEKDSHEDMNEEEDSDAEISTKGSVSNDNENSGSDDSEDSGSGESEDSGSNESESNELNDSTDDKNSKEEEGKGNIESIEQEEARGSRVNTGSDDSKDRESSGSEDNESNDSKDDKGSNDEEGGTNSDPIEQEEARGSRANNEGDDHDSSVEYDGEKEEDSVEENSSMDETGSSNGDKEDSESESEADTETKSSTGPKAATNPHEKSGRVEVEDSTVGEVSGSNAPKTVSNNSSYPHSASTANNDSRRDHVSSNASSGKRSLASAGMASGSDDRENSGGEHPGPKRRSSTRHRQECHEQATTGVGMAAATEGREVSAGATDSQNPVIVNAMGRRLRAAAIAAASAWREKSSRQARSATRRRVRRLEQPLDTPSEESIAPEWTEAILSRLVDRMTSPDGVVHYRGDWAEYENENERYTWEPAENLEGHEDWMELVDLWKDEYPTKKRTFAAFAKNNGLAIRIGAGEGMRCFFHAIRAVRHLLQLPAFDLDAAVSKLTTKGWDFDGGVKKSTLIPLVEALCKCGLQLNYHVWNKNLHRCQMGSDALGIAQAALNPGVYMVFTVDPRRLGHCWVLHQDTNYNLTAYDNGGIMDFDQMRFDNILWVRECVRFIMHRRRSRFQRKRAKLGATANA